MDWIKIPTDEILLSSRTDWQNMCLIKYIALYCQLEKQPTDAQLLRTMDRRQLKYVLSECEVVSELISSHIEVVSKKRNRDKLHYKNKANKNNDLVKIPLALRQRSDATDKIRLDKTRLEEKYMSLAKKLRDIVESKYNIKVSSDLQSWAKIIKLMEVRDKVEYSRIERGIEWLNDIANNPYTPVIQSADALRRKFVNLENAIDREKEK